MKNTLTFSANVAETQQAVPLMRKSLSGPSVCALSIRSAFLLIFEKLQRPEKSEGSLLPIVTLHNMRTRCEVAAARGFSRYSS